MKFSYFTIAGKNPELLKQHIYNAKFIAGYLIKELLEKDYQIIGFDNESKYPKLKREFDKNKNFIFYKLDIIKNYKKVRKICLKSKAEYIVNCSAVIGGLPLFVQLAYDLVATNDRINANMFDIAIEMNKQGYLKNFIQMSSSMVFESTDIFPTPESSLKDTKIPITTYGMSKLQSENYANGARQQYNLPVCVLRCFNCCGIGEIKSKKESSMTIGNRKMLMSHVLPDLVVRALKSKPTDKCYILGNGQQMRQYTNGKDIACGIRLAIESEKSINDDFNIATPTTTSVKELATKVWQYIHKCEPEFEYLPGYPNDVLYRQSDTTKAKEILGFEAKISLDESIKEVVEYIKNNMDKYE